ncbi:hypothetical protein LXD69_13365 [Flavobacterium sediminilitoris]|uniref:Uncharacterized protein n=1 Tax=Flavobacterium sediminilitoris TaxID=2024526 RepID=A0ABY4HLC6_9FLAO|nr:MULTISPECIES: hypothetical protein [Flavobacterium]UOX33022.1 hypothetical protein LXD69_13365 [Flavobacterium sediminilitoris]
MKNFTSIILLSVFISLFSSCKNNEKQIFYEKLDELKNYTIEMTEYDNSLLKARAQEDIVIDGLNDSLRKINERIEKEIRTINTDSRNKTVIFYNELNSEHKLYLNEIDINEYSKLTDSSYLKIIEVNLFILKSKLTRDFLRRSYSRKF